MSIAPVLAAAAMAAGAALPPGGGVASPPIPPVAQAAVPVAGQRVTADGAPAGTAEELYRRGRAWHRGEGVRPDRAQALAALRAAADAGHAGACEELGLMLAEERETHAEAIAMLDRAARLGRPLAQYLMGLAYADGDGVPRNPPLAMALLMRAQAAGADEAAVAIARLRSSLTAAGLAEAARYERLLAGAVPHGDSDGVSARSAGSPGVVSRPARARPAPVPQASGRWLVQMGAFRTHAAAAAAWQRLRESYPDLAQQPRLEPHDALVRLRVHGLRNRDAATALCAKAASVDLPCLVSQD